MFSRTPVWSTLAALVHEELRRDTPTGSYLLDVQSDPRFKHTGRHSFTKSWGEIHQLVHYLLVHYLLDVQSDPRLKHTGRHSFTKSWGEIHQLVHYLLVHYLLDVQSDPRLKHTGRHSFTKRWGEIHQLVHYLLVHYLLDVQSVWYRALKFGVFPQQPILHYWSNESQDLNYSVHDMVHWQSSSLFVWVLVICWMIYNRY